MYRSSPPPTLDELRSTYGRKFASALYVEAVCCGPRVLFEKHPEAETGGGILDLTCLAVHHDFRGRGIASKLTDTVLEVK